MQRQLYKNVEKSDKRTLARPIRQRFWERDDVLQVQTLLNQWALTKKIRLANLLPANSCSNVDAAEAMIDAAFESLGNPRLMIGLLYSLYPHLEFEFLAEGDGSLQRLSISMHPSKFWPRLLFGEPCKLTNQVVTRRFFEALHREAIKALLQVPAIAQQDSGSLGNRSFGSLNEIEKHVYKKNGVVSPSRKPTGRKGSRTQPCKRRGLSSRTHDGVPPRKPSAVAGTSSRT